MGTTPIHLLGLKGRNQFYLFLHFFNVVNIYDIKLTILAILSTQFSALSAFTLLCSHHTIHLQNAQHLISLSTTSSRLICAVHALVKLK